MLGNLHSEYLASRRWLQYFLALCQLMRLSLSLAAHVSPVEGSVQYPRARVSCATLGAVLENCAAAGVRSMHRMRTISSACNTPLITDNRNAARCPANSRDPIAGRSQNRVGKYCVKAIRRFNLYMPPEHRVITDAQNVRAGKRCDRLVLG
jgi:hypothetical protein